MAQETTLTIIGNLTANPELRHLDDNTAVTSFNVASTPRYYAPEAGQWRDGEPLFLRCSAWRALAENICSSLIKGARVIVTGRLKQRTYETTQGERRTVFELEVTEIGPSLRWATATVTKSTTGTPRDGGYGQRNGFGAPPDDPWATPTAANSTATRQAPEPPF